MADETSKVCQICQKPYLKFRRLKKHYLKQHSGTELLLCPFCEYVTVFTDQIKRHKKGSHPNDKFNCASCEFATKKWKKWSEHNKTHHLKNNSSTCTSEQMFRDSSSGHLENSVQATVNTDHAEKVSPTRKKKVNNLSSEEPDVQDVTKIRSGTDAFSPSSSVKIGTNPSDSPPAFHVKRSPISVTESDNSKENNSSLMDTPIVCSLCFHESASFKRLSKHFQKKHAESDVFSCQFCDFVTLDETVVSRHTKNLHSGEDLPNTSKEGKKMSSDANVRHGGDDNLLKKAKSPLQKSQSKQSSSDSSSTKYNLPPEHNGTESRPTHKGEDRGYVYDLKEHHESTSSNSLKPKQFKCDTCDFSTHYQASLKEHLLLHTGERSHVCSTCNKSFLTAKALKKHKPLHSDARPFVCQYCEFTAKASSVLKQHLRSHLNIKPYKCTFCDFETAHRTSIKYHVLKHKGLRPFACQHCAKTFISRSNMQQHIKTSHLDAEG